jgi:hypothetical protein
MTTPTPDIPANLLADARDVLHGVLEATFTRAGFPGRAEKYPPPTIRVPGGWVDAPTLSEQGQGLVATFPLIVGVDGTDAKQVERLDAILAVVWELLDRAKLGNGSALSPLTAGPDDLDLGGPTARALTITAQVPIAPRTLCPTALTSQET